MKHWPWGKIKDQLRDDSRLTSRCWWVWGQSCHLRPLRPVSPMWLRFWYLNNLVAGPPLLHWDRAGPSGKDLGHTSVRKDKDHVSTDPRTTATGRTTHRLAGEKKTKTTHAFSQVNQNGEHVRPIMHSGGNWGILVTEKRQSVKPLSHHLLFKSVSHN